MFQAMPNILLQVSHNNQTLLNFLLQAQSKWKARPNPRVKPKYFSKLFLKDMLAQLDHFEYVSNYHQWYENWIKVSLMNQHNLIML